MPFTMGKKVRKDLQEVEHETEGNNLPVELLDERLFERGSLFFGQRVDVIVGLRMTLNVAIFIVVDAVSRRRWLRLARKVCRSSGLCRHDGRVCLHTGVVREIAGVRGGLSGRRLSCVVGSKGAKMRLERKEASVLSGLSPIIRGHRRRRVSMKCGICQG